LVLGDEGRCRFLAPDGLCSMHARFGVDLLPDACITYPRLMGLHGARCEVGGSMSCPEVARQYLLHSDAFEPAPAPKSLFARGRVNVKVDPVAEDLYLRSFIAVRARALELLARQRYPLSSRLYFLACLAHEGRAVLRRGAPREAALSLQQTL